MGKGISRRWEGRTATEGKWTVSTRFAGRALGELSESHRFAQPVHVFFEFSFRWLQFPVRNVSINPQFSTNGAEVERRDKNTSAVIGEKKRRESICEYRRRYIRSCVYKRLKTLKTWLSPDAESNWFPPPTLPTASFASTRYLLSPKPNQEKSWSHFKM